MPAALINQPALASFCCPPQPAWGVSNGEASIVFSATHKSAAELPVSALIDNALSYATDLERIV
jgi:hypothetical protein